MRVKIGKLRRFLRESWRDDQLGWGDAPWGSLPGSRSESGTPDRDEVYEWVMDSAGAFWDDSMGELDEDALFDAAAARFDLDPNNPKDVDWLAPIVSSVVEGYY